ncbi:MAG TPA: UvrD-helicase domain-containing protein [Candidatus Binataceae bacterium]|nr:UvrD-helicase domain-containing protein [Candidatus Binataceae bacterium]
MSEQPSVVLDSASPADAREALADKAARDRILRDLDTTLVIEAAAGTGKTTALVSRIVAVIASGRATLDRIVAVTFTEKAAGELKLRLREEIERARTNEQEAPERRARLQDSLPQLEQARIGTIHSFCADLLSERPVQARIDPRFNVAPTDAAIVVLKRAFDSWFENELANPGPGVRRILRRRNFDNGGPRRGDGRGPRRLLFDAARNLAEWRDFDTPWRYRLFDREGEIDALLADLKGLGDLAACGKSDDWLTRAMAEFDRFLYEMNRLEAVRGARDYDALETELLALLKPRQNIWTWKGYGPVYGAREDGQKIPRPEVLERRERVHRRLEAFRDAAGAQLAPLLRDELWPVIGAYNDLKQRAGLLDFMDLLVMARDLVRDNPVVRAELQRRFTHIFIDEFQDTDPLQVEILLLLSADDPNQHDWRAARPVAGKLFIVGDPKQSIYRFRRADVALYQAVKRQLLDCGAQLEYLTASFRPNSAIAEFVNAAFAPLMVESAMQAAYAPLNALRPAASAQPALVALPVPAPWGDYGRIVKFRIDESLPQAVAGFIAWLINDSGWTITQRDPAAAPIPIQARHICILFRRFDAWGDDVSRGYMRALEARHVPHVLLGGRSFHEREEVMTLRNALMAIERPDDELAVFATLRGPIFALSDAALLTFRASVGSLHPFRKIDPPQAGELADVAEALSLLRNLHRGRNRRPIADTIQQFLSRTRAHAGFAVWPTGEQALANILRVLDKARRFEVRGGISFRGFVDQLESEAEAGEGAEAKVVEEGTEGVRMMTVHSAKGLEFPVVILADITCKETGTAQRFVDPERRLCAMTLCGCKPDELLEQVAKEERRDSEEAVRLLYVASTRARDLLVVPVFGDRDAAQEVQEEGWLRSLGPVVYPQPGAIHAPLSSNPPGCPGFGQESVSPRPASAPPGLKSVAPGLHQVAAGAHQVVWWDPNQLQLDAEEAVGLRQMRLLQADESGQASAAGKEAYERWAKRRQAVRAAAGAPMIRVVTATEVALEAGAQAPSPAQEEIELVSVARRAARPHGARFGTLVHGALLQLRLDARGDEIARTVALQGRIIGANAEEMAAAAEAVTAALGSDVMRRAHRAARCLRECPVLLHMPDGRLVEGIADLAFEEQTGAERCWTVVDFKTDAEISGHLATYRAQLDIYIEGIAQSTGVRARGVLLWV